MTIYSINQIDENKMTDIMAIAASVGSVTLRGYYTGDAVMLIEGSHRIEAAKRLQIPVNIELIDIDDPDAIIDGLDIDRQDSMTVAELTEILGINSDYWYSENDFANCSIR